jgi:copper chaperone CopZ
VKGRAPLFAAALLSLLFAGAAFYWGLRGEPARAQASAGQTRNVLLGVEGLTCGSCEGRIRRALLAVPGVERVDVDLQARSVTVVYRGLSLEPRTLAEAATRAGYPARLLGEASPPPAAPGKRESGCGGGCCAEQG